MNKKITITISDKDNPNNTYKLSRIIDTDKSGVDLAKEQLEKFFDLENE